MKRKIIPYNQKLISLAKKLRKNTTLSESLLWKCLRGKQMKGFDFHRQKVIDNYIVDFYCPDLMLAIEIDGISHENKYEIDKLKDKKLKSLGVGVLRFSDVGVKKNIDKVLWRIEQWINQSDGGITHP